MTSTSVGIGLGGTGVAAVLLVLIARLAARVSRLEGIDEERRRRD